MSSTTTAPGPGAARPGSLPTSPEFPAALRQRAAAALEAGKPVLVERWSRRQFDPALVERYGIVGVQDRRSMEVSFVGPLIDLLIAAIRTGEPRYREVYLDERLRYAPHQAEPAVRVAYFGETVPGDQADLLDSLNDPALAAALEPLLTELHAPLRGTPGDDSIRLLAVGDCLLNEVRVFLPTRTAADGIALDMRCLYFSAVVGRSIGTEQVTKFIAETAPHLISFSFLTYEGLPPYSALLREADRLAPAELEGRVTALVGSIREFLNQVREKTDAPFLIHNASGLPLTRFRRRLPLPALSAGRRRVLAALNQALTELCANTPNALLVDERAVAEERGYRESSRPVIPAAIARGAAFHTSRFGEFLAEPYREVLRSFRDLRKAKVLLVDFDNTLWEGVMADGAVVHHHDRQRLLRTLKEAGILLVALSKNDPANIRWDEMTLKQEDFVLLKISWDLKAGSIARAAEELDLGLDSFVLIDDNPAERELVRNELPKVRLLDATAAESWRSLERMLAFPNTRATEEARSRTEMYRAQAQRREAQARAFDYPSMMAALELEAAFGPAVRADLDRITELVQRTNQFNTTTIRHSKTDLLRFLESPAHGVYVADLADKFGKLGLVGVVIIERKDGNAVFDSFVMSCRAMGFGLERLMLRAAMDAEPAAAGFVGRFVPTDRNTPASGLFEEGGFRRTDATTWQLQRADTRPATPEWIRTVPRS
ncbi:MAG TPA: HAD-IIIC family phosphatase [Gemmatimonadales bacterium]|nr:HAD-IIIC family phosphatase [Gemmatimonadales bacterium]